VAEPLGAKFDEVMEHPSAHDIVNTTSACAGRAILDQNQTRLAIRQRTSSTMRVTTRRRYFESW
jgi:hypothetical protein